MYLSHHIDTIDDERIGLRAAKRSVEDTTVLRHIDALSSKHGIAASLNFCVACQAQQTSQDLRSEQIFGQVDVQVTGLIREIRDALGIGCEPGAKVRNQVVRKRSQGLP